jgi:hypothetical protein
LGNLWKAPFAVTCLSLGLASCGASPSATAGGGLAPSSPEMVSCLERGGVTAEPLDTESDLGELVAGQAANGDVIFIITLSQRDLSERAISAIRKKKREERIGGIMNTSTVDNGFTVVVAVGHEGVDGGLPSSTSERLARECATRPRT